MLKVPPLSFLSRRRHEAPAAPPAALVLTSVSYMPGVRVRLIFDRAVDISAVVPGQITVKDFDESLTFQGQAPVTLIDPFEVEIMLGETGTYFGAGILLTATALTGIVAADDGGTWAGVTDVAIPF